MTMTNALSDLMDKAERFLQPHFGNEDRYAILTRAIKRRNETL